MAMIPGTSISFSAGTFGGDLRDVDAFHYRVVKTTGGNERFVYVAKLFPGILSLLSDAIPFVINCYPATLGVFPSFVLVDTYCRSDTFSKALVLACKHQTPCLIMGQPFVVYHFLLNHAHEGLAFPARMVLALGGYTCPRSLENVMNGLIGYHGCAFGIIHAYGVAEADFACLAGIRSTDGEIYYHPIVEHVSPRIEDGILYLDMLNSEESTSVFTGDWAQETELGMLVRQKSYQSKVDILNELEKWSQAEWLRRTGYSHIEHERILWQLRPNESGAWENEIDYYDFQRLTKLSWLYKPRW